MATYFHSTSGWKLYHKKIAGNSPGIKVWIWEGGWNDGMGFFLTEVLRKVFPALETTSWEPNKLHATEKNKKTTGYVPWSIQGGSHL